MSFNFDDETKQVREFKQTIPFGVSKVQCTGVLADVTEAGLDFIEIGVVNAEGIEDSARLWFTTPQSGNISFNVARAIAVHQGKTEEEKQKIGERVDGVKNSEELAEVLNDVCGNGGELWFTKYYDPQRTYAGKDGQMRQSINKNVYGYEPKLKPELMPKAANDDGTPATIDEVVNDNDPAASNIPKSW